MFGNSKELISHKWQRHTIGLRMASPRRPHRPPKPTAFGALLDRYMERADLSLRDFASAVSRDPGLVSRIIYGERRPNPRWLPEWARRLNLNEAETAAFIDEGKIARAMGKGDSGGTISKLRDRLAVSATLLTELAALAEESGLELPKGFNQKIEALKEPL